MKSTSMPANGGEIREATPRTKVSRPNAWLSWSIPRRVTRRGEVAAIHWPVRNPNKRARLTNIQKWSTQEKRKGRAEAVVTTSLVRYRGWHQGWSDNQPDRRRPATLPTPIAEIRRVEREKQGGVPAQCT